MLCAKDNFYLVIHLSTLNSVNDNILIPCYFQNVELTSFDKILHFEVISELANRLSRTCLRKTLTFLNSNQKLDIRKCGQEVWMKKPDAVSFTIKILKINSSQLEGQFV